MPFKEVCERSAEDQDYLDIRLDEAMKKAQGAAGHHKHGSAYSRTERDEAKTPPQELSPEEIVTTFEFIFVLSMPCLLCMLSMT